MLLLNERKLSARRTLSLHLCPQCCLLHEYSAALAKVCGDSGGGRPPPAARLSAAVQWIHVFTASPVRFFLTRLLGVQIAQTSFCPSSVSWVLAYLRDAGLQPQWRWASSSGRTASGSIFFLCCLRQPKSGVLLTQLPRWATTATDWLCRFVAWLDFSHGSWVLFSAISCLKMSAFYHT